MHRRCCLQAASPVLYTTSCKHSLVVLRMGEIIARNMLNWLKLLVKLLFLHLVGCIYYCVNDSRSQKHQNYRSHCSRNCVRPLENLLDEWASNRSTTMIMFIFMLIVMLMIDWCYDDVCHPASSAMVTGSFLGIKRPERSVITQRRV